jgi:kynurenine formamidase
MAGKVSMRFALAVAASAWVAASGCAARAARVNGGSLAVARATLVDLTHPFDEGTLYWPTSPSAFRLEILHRGSSEAGYWYEANSFCAPEHGGTHLDAPVHFAEGKWSVDDIPVANLIAAAAVIDVRAAASANADYRLTVADVERWEARHGTIADGAIVVLYTGWSERWPDRKRYFGDDTPGDASKLHFPSFGEEAARFLVEQRRVRALGVDTASIDYGQSHDFPVHRLVGAANVVGLENLTNLARVPATGAWIAALPLKIARGSGAPARVVALVPR